MGSTSDTYARVECKEPPPLVPDLGNRGGSAVIIVLATMGTDDDVNIAFFPSLQCSKVSGSSQEGKAVHLRRPPTCQGRPGDPSPGWMVSW